MSLGVVGFLAGCAANVTPMATGGSRSDGVVEMSYEYSAYVTPNVNKAAGLSSAVKRCERWGYTGAEAFDAGMRTCTQPSAYGCNMWRVTTEYQCIHAADSKVSLKSNEMYGAQVESVAESMMCTESARMVEKSAESEKWVLSCGDGETLQLRCFEDACYVK